MESQNIDRRDSKKSNNKGGGNKGQARGGGGGGGGGGGSGGGGKTSAGGGEKQRSHSQKSGKRYQEIYKPPSLRSSKNRNSNSSSDQQSSTKGGNSHEEALLSGSNNSSKKNNSNGNNQLGSSVSGRTLGNISPQFNGNDVNNEMSSNAYSLFGNGNGTQANNGNSSVPSSPLISSRMQNSFNFNLAKRMFNVNAKEFQFLPIQQQQQHQAQQQQQISNFLSQFDPSLLYNNSPILASTGCYPLKQSKSSGNMNMLLQQAQQQQQAQAVALQQLQLAMGLNSLQQSGNFAGGGNASNSNQFNRLCQSKSSGNVPGNGNRPRVRFDDEEVDFDDVDEDFIGGQLGNYLASLKLNGDLSGLSSAAGGFPIGFPFQQQQQQQQQAQMQQSKAVPLSPQPVLKSSLQKSRTGFYLNLYGNQQQQQSQQMQLGSPTKPVYGFNPSSMHTGTNYAAKMSGGGMVGSSPHAGSFSGNNAGVVKRSRSFGPGNHHPPRVSATALLNATSTPQCSTSAGHSVYSDFCITKWPRVVQELVTAAVTGVERIPARNWIEMVNGIFEAMLCDYRPKKKDKNMMTTTHGEDSKSVGITTGEKATSGISASSDTNNDKFSAELSLAAGSASSGGDTTRRNQNADLAAAQNNDHACNLDDNEDDEGEDDDDDDTDLTSAAVHIFLYFIQREKDRTVMESLLNTCFASFQRLSSSSIGNPANSSATSGKSSSRVPKIMDQKGKPPIPRQWCNFLRFLSTLYSQVKLIRRQKQSQQQPGHSMNEMSFSLLALLCDSCLATLRSPQSYTAEMMGCLFTVLTSIGRDMEGTFPLKMKQLLAAVRDALLGIGPYHQQQQQHLYNPNSSSPSGKSSVSSLSPIVQKTLMQLIELHAANWQLPASAVRYYYSSVSNSKSTTSSTTNGGGSSSVGSHQNQSQKSNNNSSSSTNNSSVPTTTATTISPNHNISSTSNATVQPSSSSSVGCSSNEHNETKDNSAGASVTSAVSSVSVSMSAVEEKGNSCVTGNGENESAKNDTTSTTATELEDTPQQ